ncbi:hypothetical protein GGS23DRAFT_445242 [Durotheca rogersii]|uniref:uncharacterized protein n=1 Tax=Durotheca rogersii TaxID=419775 RepID=UPI00221FEE88|nr:uncharacterized protein GGS23DRAFT_445242 [Durotheca rogersii]KAI5855131.1 hypothetical protein GGS23DRAFT_445242 [Durotheca rogersii]
MLAVLPSLNTGISLAYLLLTFAHEAHAGLVLSRQTPENLTGTSAAAVSTITGYAHPLSLTPLSRLGPLQTPLSYADPPTAITVPTRRQPPFAAAASSPAHASVWRSSEAEDNSPSGTLLAQATDLPPSSSSSPAPASLSPTTAQAPVSVCTSIAGSYPTATLPNFCAPSAHANAPALVPAVGAGATGSARPPTATVTIGGVTNKLDCCVQCAGIFNCVAWRFLPVFTQPPNAHLPGGFDPWGRGDCLAVYHIDSRPPRGGAGGEVGGDVSSLCPNGNVGEVLQAGNRTEDGAPEGGQGEEKDAPVRSWSQLYYNGWNEGPCGAPIDAFESGYDAGRGDRDKLCSQMRAT